MGRPHKVSLKELEILTRRILRLLRLPPRGVAVFLLTPRAMRQAGKALSRERRKHTPEVLSFTEPSHFPHPERTSRFFGEVFLNRELAHDRAKLMRMLTHGILHLAGYTHETKRDILEMEKLERETLDKLK